VLPEALTQVGLSFSGGCRFVIAVVWVAFVLEDAVWNDVACRVMRGNTGKSFGVPSLSIGQDDRGREKASFGYGRGVVRRRWGYAMERRYVSLGI
jgi:hypothetical protein